MAVEVHKFSEFSFLLLLTLIFLFSFSADSLTLILPHKKFTYSLLHDTIIVCRVVGERGRYHDSSSLSNATLYARLWLRGG